MSINKLHIAKWFVYLTLIILTVGIGTFIYWSAQSTDVIVVKNAPVPVNQITAPTGQGVVILKVDYCKNAKASGKIRVSFVSSTREIFLPMADVKQPIGCHVADFPIIIPSDAAPDTYHVHFRSTYYINPVHPSVIEEFDSKPFKISGVGADNQKLVQ